MVEGKPVDVTPELDGGVMKTIIKYGEGTSQPSKNCKVIVHYTGKLTDGTVFDSSRDREPFEFDLGRGSVIKAWDIGVATMKKGEIATFECKPEYAYGSAGSPPKIPPNATLIFEVEMIGWKAEDLSPKKDGSILRTVLEVGEGFSYPNDGATVEIHVTGEYNGHIFEDRDVTFPLGEGSEYGICDGVEKALKSFRIPEKSKLEIKPKYAFGSAGKPEFNIPPNATVHYTVKLNNFEKLKDFWSLDAPEKIMQAEFFKEKGTKYFQEGKYPLAIKIYKKMDDYIGNDVGYSEEMNSKRLELKKAMHLNLALCNLKLNRNVEARHECDAVLSMDPTNVKALFRRGQTFLNTAEPELAQKDFEEVLKLDPQNAAAARNINQCKEILKKQRSQEKKIYANMFEKFAKHDKESRDWVYGWWDGKQVNTEKYVPLQSEEDELKKRREERAALLKELERKKKEIASLKEKAIENGESSEGGAGLGDGEGVEGGEEEKQVSEATDAPSTSKDAVPSSSKCDDPADMPDEKPS